MQKQALGVSRIISAAARVARARKAIGEGSEDTLTAAISWILREQDEADAERRRQTEQGVLSREAYEEIARANAGERSVYAWREVRKLGDGGEDE